MTSNNIWNKVTHLYKSQIRISQSDQQLHDCSTNDVKIVLIYKSDPESQMDGSMAFDNHINSKVNEIDILRQETKV